MLLHIYNSLVGGHCLRNWMEEATRVFGLMVSEGERCLPSVVTRVIMDWIFQNPI